jgi:hypothetical protein
MKYSFCPSKMLCNCSVPGRQPVFYKCVMHYMEILMFVVTSSTCTGSQAGVQGCACSNDRKC